MEEEEREYEATWVKEENVEHCVDPKDLSVGSSFWMYSSPSCHLSCTFLHTAVLYLPLVLSRLQIVHLKLKVEVDQTLLISSMTLKFSGLLLLGCFKTNIRKKLCTKEEHRVLRSYFLRNERCFYGNTTDIFSNRQQWQTLHSLLHPRSN